MSVLCKSATLPIKGAETMKVIIAPDAFKGSLTADEAAEAMQTGVKKVFPQAETMCLPVADGGEGTLSALISATGGVYKTFTVRNPSGI